MLGDEDEMGLGRLVGLGPETVIGPSPIDRRVRGLRGEAGARTEIGGGGQGGGRGLEGMSPRMEIATGVGVVVDDDGDRGSGGGRIEER